MFVVQLHWATITTNGQGFRGKSCFIDGYFSLSINVQIYGTPFVFVNGIRIVGGCDVENVELSIYDWNK